MPYAKAISMPDNSSYTVKTLLAKGKQNTKTAKSDKAGLGYITTSLSLAPAKASGFNVCTSASGPCIASCLYTSGYAMVHPRKIQPARIAKTRFLRLHPDEFRARLEIELNAAVRRAKKLGLKLAARLNVISDIEWEAEFPGLIESYPDVQWYDYTKHFDRMGKFLAGDFPTNYDLTFSWSGRNEVQSLAVLANGGNVAVPFHVKYRGDKRQPLPAEFKGFPVIDGDITDLRFLDAKGGNVVGLRAKGKAKKDFTSGFVIPVETIQGEPMVKGG